MVRRDLKFDEDVRSFSSQDSSLVIKEREEVVVPEVD
jgi:hypothetical protein